MLRGILQFIIKPRREALDCGWNVKWEDSRRGLSSTAFIPWTKQAMEQQ